MLRSLSLTNRLTIFFTLAAASIVLGLGVLLMVATERHFLELDRMTLQDKQRLIEDILTNANSSDDAKWRLREALNNHHGLYVFAKDPQGNVFFSTNGFSPAQDLISSTKSNAKPVLLHWKDAGVEYRGLSMQIRPAYQASTKLDILVAINTEHHMHFMTELQRSLAIYAILATVVSGLLGWLAAHQGLAPLRAMKTSAAVVNSQQLSQRMPVEAVPVEMADLAHALNQMLDRLQSDFQRLSEFSSDLAHELRTPISNLLTQTQVALSKKRDADTYREILASNAEEFQRLGRMVADMLFLAKTERGLDLPSKEQFSAAQEVRALVEFYEAVADEKQIKISQQGDGVITGDRLMFRRAVSNLLSNAIRYTSSRGVVAIHVSKTPAATFVTVANTGDAIDPKALPRLFDRFYRADSARVNLESDGSGLGLSITRAIVESHGGKATVTSSQGETRFTLEFPQQEEHNT